jgi:hypothetical protein
MIRALGIAAAAVLAASCSEDAPRQEAPAEAPATMAAGQYEASWTVDSLRSVDKATPVTNLKEKANGTALGCVGADGKFDLAMFAEDGDECQATNSYMRGGRISIDVGCRREGDKGEVRQSINGTYDAQGFRAEVSTTTYLAAVGDYAMVRTFTGKRVGECPPASEAAEKTS